MAILEDRKLKKKNKSTKESKSPIVPPLTGILGLVTQQSIFPHFSLPIVTSKMLVLSVYVKKKKKKVKKGSILFLLHNFG